MFTAYSDAAGGKDHGFVVVAGFVSSFDLWDRFAVDWRIALSALGIPYVHMKAFAHYKDPYCHLKGEVEQTAHILHTLAKVITDYSPRAFSTALSFRDFESVNQRFCLKESLRTPYAVCAFDCVHEMTAWAARLSRQAVQCVFDEGDDGWGSVQQFAREKEFPEPISRPSRDKMRKLPSGEEYLEKGILQLQAADFLAYELRKAVVDHGPDPPHDKYRASMKALGEGAIVHKHTGYTASQLEGFCDCFKIPRRAGVK
ncbi:MAG TPA: hypothetical protein VG206_10175 [Terriglobia bacterium]|nr:hypothetical protein [Terriglobia bacterium]